MLPKEEFKQLIKTAIRKYLDRLADKIDRHYARLGISKREVKKDHRKITRTSGKQQLDKQTKEIINDHEHNSERIR